MFRGDASSVKYKEFGFCKSISSPAPTVSTPSVTMLGKVLQSMIAGLNVKLGNDVKFRFG